MNGKNFFRNPMLLVGMLVLGAIVLAACQPAATPEPMPVDIAPAITIQVATDPTLGKILVDGKGMTLYMYTKDEPNKSNCTGDCLVNWPPLLAVDNPGLGDGVDAAMLGTADLADGSKIVTYNKMPLYYWKNDAEPGQTTGQDVGGVWYVVSPAGEVIK